MSDMSDFMQTDLIEYADIGFTGTRKGMTQDQQLTVEELLIEIFPPERVHHGDCIGSDEVFHEMVKLYWQGSQIVGHPPRSTKYRAFCKVDVLLPTDEYLVRNKKIVNSSDLLIATPGGPEHKRSGTWSTIRYAKQRRVEIKVVWPDGSIL